MEPEEVICETVPSKTLVARAGVTATAATEGAEVVGDGVLCVSGTEGGLVAGDGLVWVPEGDVIGDGLL